MSTLEDTIAAIATPVGDAGIAVIRISGPRAIEICDQRFRGKRPLSGVATQTAHYGDFENRNGERIDEVVATIFRGPHSFTAEDVVEIGCHGGSYVTKTVLAALVESGARHAEPGEFTKRAFLNGRIDLSQAEAVADLIHARSRLSHQASIQQLSGRISQQIQRLRKSILDISSLLELELDFTEEGIDLLKKEDLLGGLTQIISSIQQLINSYERGRIVRDGVKVVLAGRPNVGKSSILNSLLNYDRAIVSEVPGTTRDTLEENISIGGLLFSITDTAGLRDSFDKIEEMGVERARKELQSADVILLVMDSSSRYLPEDFRLVRECELEAKKLGGRLLILENKIDLPDANNENQEWSWLNGVTRIRLSAKTGQSIEQLRSNLLECAQGSERSFEAGSAIITSQRHRECLSRAKTFLETALVQGEKGTSPELIADNLNLSTKALGEIIGEVTSDEILNNIFSHFCIGK